MAGAFDLPVGTPASGFVKAAMKLLPDNPSREQIEHVMQIVVMAWGARVRATLLGGDGDR